jgi:hypothetical protein
MTDHELVTIIFLTINIALAVSGFGYMNRMLREAERMTRAVASLVVQETEMIRNLMSAR